MAMTPAEIYTSPEGDVFLLDQVHEPSEYMQYSTLRYFDLSALDIVRQEVVVATETLNGQRDLSYDAVGTLVSGLEEIVDTISVAQKGAVEIETKKPFALGRGLWKLYEEFGVDRDQEQTGLLRLPTERITDVKSSTGKGRMLTTNITRYNPVLDLRIQFAEDLAQDNEGESPHLKHLFREDRPGQYYRIGFGNLARLSLLETLDSIRYRTRLDK
ncbi:MAG TPA: hypothetical protein PKB09_04470 [Candidatus Saccharibacteria bacterium]|nr:hypothetical protein [Candidatus Saccharibacteria bacterium]